MHIPPEPPPPRHAPSRALKIAGVVGLGLAGLLVLVGLISRSSAHSRLRTWTDAQAVPTVSVIHASFGGGSATLVLPGQVAAFYNASIHSRVSGYLTHWYSDIGATVKAGAVLAVIETPDLDQQLERAKADLVTAQANQSLAVTTARRWAGLLLQDAVSRQETDEKAGDLAAKTSLVQAARAQVAQLRAEESFKTIRAPFAGVVTARNTDIGALIAAGTPNDPGLFTVSDIHRLRIYVRVPQIESADIRPGMIASLTVPEYPGRVFQATLVSTSSAVGEQTGTLLVELQMDNPGLALKPGDYAEVRLALPSHQDLATIPASATLFRQRGLAVATVGRGDRVVIKPITVAKDLGASVEIASGLSAGDGIIDNPPDSITQGELVRVAAAPPIRATTVPPS